VARDLDGDTGVVLERLGSQNADDVIGVVPFPTGATMEIHRGIFVSPRPYDSRRPMLAGNREMNGTDHDRHQDGSHEIPGVHLCMGRDCYG